GGEVISTLVLRTRRAKTQTLKPEHLHRHERRLVMVDVTYRVTRATGEAAADVRAAEPPACRLLDACGASGGTTYSVDTPHGSLDLFGYAPARGRRKPTLRRALAMALRHGELEGFGA